MAPSSGLFSTLAIIADCYTPLLLLIALARVVTAWRDGKRTHGVFLLCSVFIVYMWMFIDEHLLLWSSFGLDYSTHTAAAFALVVLIGVDIRRFYQQLLSVSLVSYGCLMYVLKYHSWGDMISTLAIIAVCLLPIIYSLNRQSRLPQAG